MKKFSRTTDKIEESGFINKDQILEYVTEEDIFQLVFGFKPVEFDYVTSPFREDKNPGCWFERDFSTNRLRFTDFADNRRIKGVKMLNIDCFDAVKIYFDLPNFYSTLNFIKTHLIDGKDIKNNIKVFKKEKAKKKVHKKEVKILLNTRNFLLKDKNYWLKRYGISKQNLIDDKVFPIKRFKLLNTKKGDFTFNTNDLAYAYTEFKNGKKKIYRPLQKGPKRFITNCTADDIGGMNTPIKAGRLLIITKSYKDYRVLRNQGLNVRWLQNEGMFPKSREFWSLIENFDEVVVIFDNDETGLRVSKQLVDLINFTEINKARSVHIPENFINEGISDPSDLRHKKGEKELINFLKENNIL